MTSLDAAAERVARLRSGATVVLDDLPVLPAVLVRLMSVAPGDDALFDVVLGVASDDPGFALRVVRAANSPISAPVSPVDTLEGAIAWLGAHHVAELLTVTAVARVFVPRRPSEQELWLHAVDVAVASRAIVDRHGAGQTAAARAYLAGLLHDVGRLMRFDQAADAVDAVDDRGWTTPDEHRGGARGVRDRPRRARRARVRAVGRAGRGDRRRAPPPRAGR